MNEPHCPICSKPMVEGKASEHEECVILAIETMSKEDLEKLQAEAESELNERKGIRDS